eukprot:CAMPEP_0194443272 /NCGR_PEP_ID=MMETSP0176-20130528/126609_1 /TAXON_ID=216777 /ORGANISM="Proboscia alata, Strain PI-D3" /LENGTH=192 /DNA_ID=CAMNT_0039269497 /DNA_START=520 /DNA_END=1099 /DNA_ORIENTATION=-
MSHPQHGSKLRPGCPSVFQLEAIVLNRRNEQLQRKSTTQSAAPPRSLTTGFVAFGTRGRCSRDRAGGVGELSVRIPTGGHRVESSERAAPPKIHHVIRPPQSLQRVSLLLEPVEGAHVIVLVVSGKDERFWQGRFGMSRGGSGGGFYRWKSRAARTQRSGGYLVDGSCAAYDSSTRDTPLVLVFHVMCVKFF